MDNAAMQAELDQLRAVRLRLLSGQQAEEVRVGSVGAQQRSIRYAATNMNELNARIRSLESALGLSSGRRAIGVNY